MWEEIIFMLECGHRSPNQISYFVNQAYELTLKQEMNQEPQCTRASGVNSSNSCETTGNETPTLRDCKSMDHYGFLNSTSLEVEVARLDRYHCLSETILAGSAKIHTPLETRKRKRYLQNPSNQVLPKLNLDCDRKKPRYHE